MASPPRVRRAGHDHPLLPVTLEPGHGPIDVHPVGTDALDERVEEGLPRAARVTELLLARLLALDLAPQRELAPQPDHGDLLRARAELPSQQRPPDLLPRLTAHALLDPLTRRDLLVGRAIAAEALQRDHRRAHPHA